MNKMLKKIIGLTIFALCIANSSFAELQHFSMYGEYQLRDVRKFTQLRDITVNGLTVDEAKAKAYAAATREAIQYLGSEEALKSHFDAMAKIQKVEDLAERHKSMSNIIERSSYKIHKTPFDFVQFSDGCIHWIPGINSEETCKHYNYDEMKEHAEVYTALLMARMLVMDKPKQMENYMNTKDKVTEIFSRHYDTALTPFFEAKEAQMQAEADRLNRNMKDYNCRAVLHTRPNEASYIPVIGGLFSGNKTTYCKSQKKCKFFAGHEDGILGMYCMCGHPIEMHQYKLKGKAE